MTITTLRGGAAPKTATELSPEQLNCAGESVDRDAITRLARRAMGEPLGLPPLAQCLTPDDHVALAVAPGAPEAGAVVAGVVAALVDAGIDRKRVRVVAADPREVSALEASLAEEVEAGVGVESHDPHDDDGLCFAGITRAEQPLLLNRTLFDADVVLPIAGQEPDGQAEGMHYGLYPDFFDRATIQRHLGVETGNHEGSLPLNRLTEAEEAVGVVGASVILRAAPDATGGVAAVLAGLPYDVGRAAAEVDRTAGVTPLVEPADLVLAIVTGGAEQQTWESVARALEASEPLTKPGGAVAVWSDVADAVDEIARQIDEIEHAENPFGEGEPTQSAAVATRLAEALERGPLFLRSRVPAEAVESLGFGPVADEAEMQRLVGRFETCTVLEGAQHARFAVDSGEPA